MPENKFKIGITQGDTNGIGWEVILKALADSRGSTELFTPVVYGSPKAAGYYRKYRRGDRSLLLQPRGVGARRTARPRKG